MRGALKQLACVRGGAILAISFLFPFVGWFMILPVALVSGVGAVVIAGWRSRRIAPPVTLDPEMGMASAT